MPPWRGTLSLEEAWAMGRYLRTFVPGTEASRPDFSTPEKPSPARFYRHFTLHRLIVEKQVEPNLEGSTVGL